MDRCVSIGAEITTSQNMRLQIQKRKSQRFESARQTAMEQLKALYEKALAEVGEEGAELFEAHQMMLDDLDYVEGIQDLIDGEQVNAEYAVSQVAEQFAQMFASMDDSYMQARAADVKDISNRVIGILGGVVAGGIDSDVPVILAADDLAPSETVQLDKSKNFGLCHAGRLRQQPRGNFGAHDGHSGCHRYR